MHITLIRHGETKGNLEKRYIGTTDEDLSKYGIINIKKNKYPPAERIISSPLKRCVQTARIIYKTEPEIFYDLRECDFGDFENKSFNELKDNPDYIKWLKSDGRMTFPNGESHFDFCERCCICFEKIIKSNNKDSVSFIIHGGTIMAILQRYYSNKSFYDWQIKNGEFISFEITLKKNNILII